METITVNLEYYLRLIVTSRVLQAMNDPRFFLNLIWLGELLFKIGPTYLRNRLISIAF